MLGADPEISRELTAGELAADHDVIRGLDHALLDDGIEPVGIEVMMVGHHGDVEPIAPAGDQGGRADEA